jgi:RNA recognition motif-containing protein
MLRVFISKPPATEDSTALERTLFVSNLPFDDKLTTEDSLRSHFNQFKFEIEEIRLIRDAKTGHLKGFAYI